MVISLKSLLWLREQHCQNPEDPCAESAVTEGIEGFKWETNMCVFVCKHACVLGFYCVDIMCEGNYTFSNKFLISHFNHLRVVKLRNKMVFILLALIGVRLRLE